MRILRRVLSHACAGALFRIQFEGLPSAARGASGKMQRLRSVRHVLPRLRHLRSQDSGPENSGERWRCKMKADPRGVLTGTHFIDGDHACCEGALAAGARFAAGYPITPSTEVVERFAARVPTVGGTFIQMEDELAASITLQGAVWGGAKAFTVTSGPGFSLMMEHIGYAAMTETPCVFVDVQRG